MEALNGVKKRHFRVEGFQWPFSRVAMEWRPGAGTAKRKKISSDINVATPPPPPLLPHPSSLLSLRQLNHSPPPHDPNFLRALQANALRTMSVNGKGFLSNPWSNRAAWSRVQSTLGSKKDHGGDLMNKKRQLELWDLAGFSREKLKLLNEIEVLIDSEENALNMEASAKAAEGRLRSLLDICVCSQCQENIENRIALQSVRTKGLDDGKVISARTNVATAKQEDQTAPALEGPKTTKLPESLEKEREKERRFFLGNVKEAMERDRVALDNFLQKQRLKHEVSKQKLGEVKGSFLGKYLSFLDNSLDDALQKDDLSDKHDQDSEGLEDPSKLRKDQTPELERSSEKSDDRTEESITTREAGRKPADVSLSTDAKKLHETIHKLLDKNKQLQEMLSGRQNSHDHQRQNVNGLEHITKLEISCSCKSPWEMRPPRIFNFTRKTTSRVLQTSGELDIGSLEETAGTRTGYEGFPQGYSYLYVSPAFEAENVDPNTQTRDEDRSASKHVVTNPVKLHKLKQEQEVTHSQEQNFCPKFKLSSLPALCSSFTQTTCDSRGLKQLDLQQPKVRPQLEESKAKTDEHSLVERQDKAVDAGDSSDETDVSSAMLIDVIRNWRMQALVPKDLLENKDSCTQTAVSLTEVGQITEGKPVVEKFTQGDALLEISLLCQEEENKLKALEELDVKDSHNNLSETTESFSSDELIEVTTQLSESVEGVARDRSTEQLEAAFKRKEEDLENIVHMLSSKLVESQDKADALEKSLAEKSFKVEEMLEALKTFQAEESQDSCKRIAALEQALAEKSFSMDQMSRALATANSYAEQLRKDFEEAFDDTLRKELATSQDTISNLVEEAAEKDVKLEEMKLEMEAIQNLKSASDVSRTGLEAKVSEERHNAREAYASLESVKSELSNCQAKARTMEEAVAQRNATVQRLELRLKEMENSQSVFEKSQAMLTRQLEGARNSVKEMVQILGTERLSNTEKYVSLEEALNAKSTKIKELELKAQEMQKLKSAMELEMKNATENAKSLHATLNTVKRDLSRADHKTVAMEQSLAAKDAKLQQLQDQVVALEFENFQLRGQSRAAEKQSSDHRRQFEDLVAINEELLSFSQGKENEVWR
ncbi:hypothetical protein SELMODRAFT_423863 [Selaginella moellendorffii]|uniref:Uncharacterized protein n=1 Tax=Selaginella moellendorffii TaxID=88036 RepID=D8SN20_SELML|nr:protein MLP1 isoform X1 [Selaginella moellendorffii]EFJ13988.1 hypothetical protein SELMODRAFT_423863 [Selaginella moellendorffii]|eukprot:XP_002984738.1 protein MLP1 isoform X1 [Selaginella moellendorffii]